MIMKKLVKIIIVVHLNIFKLIEMQTYSTGILYFNDYEIMNDFKVNRIIWLGNVG